MKKRKKLLKNILIVSLICTLSIMSRCTVASADETVENELQSVIQSYGQEEVIIEDGISLHFGETRDFSEHPNWKLSNNNVVSMGEKGQLKAIGSGTVFLSQKIGDKVHIIEVYVPEMQPRFYSSYSVLDEPSRNYYKVFVDAGHGGIDPGAIGFGKNESELNLEVAKRVEQKLKAKNIQVEMSRETDDYVGINERANLANNYGADVFVSIHHNSASIESANGIETFYHPTKEMYKPLAVDIQKNAILQTGARDRGVKNYRDLGVLRESNMPSALFESGFISNGEEYNKLIDPVYQDKLASGIANGIENYLKENIKLPGDSETPKVQNGIVISNELEVRSGAGLENSIKARVKKGEIVELYEIKDEWIKVKLNNGTVGWVELKNIKIYDENNLSEKGIVISNELEVRSGAGLENSIKARVKKGEIVELYEIKDAWIKVKLNNGTVGWGELKNIKIYDENDLNKKGIVISNELEVRSGAGLENSIKARVKKGEIVELYETRDEWIKVKLNNGTVGWVELKNIKIYDENNLSEKGIVISNELEVRSGAGLENSIKARVKKGEIVELYEIKDAWIKVKLNNGTVGWGELKNIRIYN